MSNERYRLANPFQVPLKGKNETFVKILRGGGRDPFNPCGVDAYGLASCDSHWPCMEWNGMEWNGQFAERISASQPVRLTDGRVMVPLGRAAVNSLTEERSRGRRRPVAPPGGKGGSFPLWADVQKLCNMCALSLSWNFFVSHDKYIARPSSKEPR